MSRNIVTRQHGSKSKPKKPTGAERKPPPLGMSGPEYLVESLRPLLICIVKPNSTNLPRVIELADPRQAFCREYNRMARKLGEFAEPISSCLWQVWMVGEPKPIFEADNSAEAQAWIDVWREGDDDREVALVPVLEGGEV